MKKRDKHVQNASGVYEAIFNVKSREEMLMKVLNDEPFWADFKFSRKEVNRRYLLLFVKRFQQYDAALQAARGSPDYGKIPFGPDTDADRIERKIQRLLNRFSVTPGLTRSRENPGWDLMWFKGGKKAQPWPHFETAHEFALVMDVMEVAKSGRLSLLKQCAHCNRWLLARRSDQTYCGKACYDTFHSTNPKDKARRREWARKNYWLHKNKNIK